MKCCVSDPWESKVRAFLSCRPECYFSVDQIRLKIQGMLHDCGLDLVETFPGEGRVIIQSLQELEDSHVQLAILQSRITKRKGELL